MAANTPQFGVGLHTASFVFFGNPTDSNTIAAPVRFMVYPANSPPPVSLSIAVAASPFAQGENVGVTIAASCSPVQHGDDPGRRVLRVRHRVDGEWNDLELGVLERPCRSAYDPGHLRNGQGVTVAVSPPIDFTVVENTLPVPTETITLSPATPMTGTAAWISVALSCRTTCGGAGQLSIDNCYAGFNVLDGNGVAWFYTPFTAPFDAVGPHTISF